MAKLWFVVAFFAAVSFACLEPSRLDDHSLFYVSGDDIHGIVKRDVSFTVAPAFFLLEKLPFLKRKIQTGEYEVKKGEPAIAVILKMLDGKRVRHKLTIPEGYTVKMISDIIDRNELLFGEVPAEIPEASLAPNTYFYYFGDTKASLVAQMREQMQLVRQKLLVKNSTSLSADEVITLASIIEKESGNKGERRTISSVFHNRLAIKMRLQSDPTVVYTLSNGLGKLKRALTRRDLQFPSPYNTYRNAGLPPNPICCPGEDAILAAMTPEKTDYLYFVANKEHTGHIFSRDYKAHLAAVRSVKR
ncbi:MAG: endolytic transglycosylase MltG [Alphaproteobacteria bacterium]|nr:endolytic transglycosylase MltG [Alphaproteobacteria bacterium]